MSHLTSPLLLSTSPSDGSTDVALGANLVLTFDETVMAGTGAIEIRHALDGSLALSISVNDTSQVSFSGATMTINPSVDLDPFTPYFIRIGAGIVTDLANNPFAGILGSEFNFLTVDPDPLNLVSASPTDDALNVPVNGDLRLTFDEEVEARSGAITIRFGADGNFNEVMVIDVNDASQVIFSGNTVTINPSADLDPGTEFVVTIGAFAIVGVDSSAYPGIFVFDEYNFTTGIGMSVNFGVVDPATYMGLIRDFDGNDLGGAAASWILIGSADIQNDTDIEWIYVNQEIGRWATVGTAEDGLVYFSNHSWGGDTRVVGIYIDPLVESGDVEQGGPFDSQQRFQNDLFIENINDVLGAGDYDGDGLQEIYFGLTDETAYLHAYMHADGNIQYANYQNETQMIDYLSGFGYGVETWGDWLYGGAAASSAGVSAEAIGINALGSWNPIDAPQLVV
jgi:methionine-rich copper-binding protein CopC